MLEYRQGGRHAGAARQQRLPRVGGASSRRPGADVLPHGLQRVLGRKKEGSLPSPVPSVSRQRSSSANADELLHFWRTVAADPSDIARLGDAAMRALSIPISQTVVERSFSVISNREIDNRLQAGYRYVSNMLMLACNRSYFTEEATRSA